ncbi:MAG: hypothetical protein OXB88_10450 [Bacteriovoracales bacterium]|nr:hypothetical protein [Bacteriovoracales bacterium]
MRLCDALQEKEMDIRLRDRQVSKGQLRPQDLENYLSSLPDDSDNYVTLYTQDTQNAQNAEDESGREEVSEDQKSEAAPTE